MNEPAIQKWVAALRSGEYKQGREALKTVDGNGQAFHCCLGVLCEIFKKEGNELAEEKRSPHSKEIKFGGYYGYPPTRVREWIGLASEEGSFRGSIKDLATMNDNGSSFAEIANIIESKPEGLFLP